MYNKYVTLYIHHTAIHLLFLVLMSNDQYELQQNKKHPILLNWGTTDNDVYAHLEHTYNTLDC